MSLENPRLARHVIPVMVVFREAQRFPIWADLLMLLAPAAASVIAFTTEPGQTPKGLWALALSGPAVWLLLFRMVTVVDASGIVVSFGWAPTYRYRLRFDKIESLEPVSYNPLREYGGWGIRGVPVSCLNARGRLGVHLRLKNGRSLLIGSQRPHDLHAAVLAGISKL